MARMLDMIKQSTVPANLMRTAAKGALALPAPEMIEIRCSSSHHHVVGEQASMTLQVGTPNRRRPSPPSRDSCRST